MRAVAAPRTPAATFFGRSEEPRAASELVRGDARLITIHGAPGVGKSRLLRELEALDAGYSLLEKVSVRHDDPYYLDAGAGAAGGGRSGGGGDGTFPGPVGA
jgi:hypothetical protein